MAGATYGFGTLSSPTASVADQSVKPLSDLDSVALLEEETARRLLERAGITDTDGVEWQTGPREVTSGFDDQSVTMLGTETTLQSFEGIVGGKFGLARRCPHRAGNQ